MILKFCIVMTFVVCFSGCATPGRNLAAQITQCRERIEELEQELIVKERQASHLERELARAGADREGKYAMVRKSHPVLAISNPSTSQIQKALKRAGYYSGAVDGKFGPQTTQAIQRFQKDNGLKVDGKVGRMTWSELKSFLRE